MGILFLSKWRIGSRGYDSAHIGSDGANLRER